LDIIALAIGLAAATGEATQAATGAGLPLTDSPLSPAVTIAIAIVGGLFGAGGLAAIIKTSSEARSQRIEGNLQETKSLQEQVNTVLSIQNQKLKDMASDQKALESEQEHLKDKVSTLKSSYSSALWYIGSLLRYIDEIRPDGARPVPRPPQEIFDKLNEQNEEGEPYFGPAKDA